MCESEGGNEESTSKTVDEELAVQDARRSDCITRSLALSCSRQISGGGTHSHTNMYE